MSYASYALRFAVGFDGMMMVLSGMSDMNQMKDNLSFMKDFQPLSLRVCQEKCVSNLNITKK